MTDDESTTQCLRMLEDALARVRRDGALSVEIMLRLPDETCLWNWAGQEDLATMKVSGGVQ